jgi:hypothetical protein
VPDCSAASSGVGSAGLHGQPAKRRDTCPHISVVAHHQQGTALAASCIHLSGGCSSDSIQRGGPPCRPVSSVQGPGSRCIGNNSLGMIKAMRSGCVAISGPESGAPFPPVTPKAIQHEVLDQTSILHVP